MCMFKEHMHWHLSWLSLQSYPPCFNTINAILLLRATAVIIYQCPWFLQLYILHRNHVYVFTYPRPNRHKDIIFHLHIRIDTLTYCLKRAQWVAGDVLARALARRHRSRLYRLLKQTSMRCRVICEWWVFACVCMYLCMCVYANKHDTHDSARGTHCSDPI